MEKKEEKMKTRKIKVNKTLRSLSSLPSNIVRIYSVKWLYCFTYNYTGGTLVNRSIYDVNSFDHQLLHRHPTKVSIWFIPASFPMPPPPMPHHCILLTPRSPAARAKKKFHCAQCLRFLVNRFRLLAYTFKISKKKVVVFLVGLNQKRIFKKL